MHFEIETAWKPHKDLTVAQFQSLKFEREPRIAGEVLSHHRVLKLTKEQMLIPDTLFRVRELLSSESILVFKAGEAGRYSVTLPMLTADAIRESMAEPVEMPRNIPHEHPEYVEGCVACDAEVASGARVKPMVEATTEVPVEPTPPLTTEPSVEPVSADPVSEVKPAEVQADPVPEIPVSADVSADPAPAPAAEEKMEPVASPTEAAAPKAKRGKKAKQTQE